MTEGVQATERPSIHILQIVDGRKNTKGGIHLSKPVLVS